MTAGLLLRYIYRGLVALFAIIGLLFTAVFFGMRFGAFNVKGSIADRNAFFTGTSTDALPPPACIDDSTMLCDWNTTSEWQAIKGGLIKDAEVINRVAAETGVSARMIASVVVPEQTRFFTASRDLFKRYFEPLKILGTLSQFSLGVSGIKEATANAIELYASTPSSSFYPGAGMAQLIAYTDSEDHDATLFARLTDTKNHYHQYLYTALFIKEIQSQWNRAGYPVDTKPEVIVTLFNIGFSRSKPNANPRAGGAPITTGGQTYPYGELGALFYYSDELIDIFPR